MVALVLLPGMDGTGSLFQPLIERFSGSISIHVVRYPATQALGYEALEKRVKLALPDNEPYVLLGESFSGPIAISLAATRPAGLIGVILCSSFATNPRPRFSLFRWLAKVLPLKWMPLALLDNLLLGRHSTPVLREALSDAINQVSPEALGARLDSLHRVDVLWKLKSISVPLLYLQANEDRIVPRTAAALIQAHHPATRLMQFDAPHGLLQSVPEEAAAAIQSFIDEAMRQTLNLE